MLRIPRAVLEAILAHARAAAPEEACGILAGRAEGASRVVAQAIPVRNAHEEPRVGYRLDPEEQLRAILRIEDDPSLELVGFYHSHPQGPAAFSATDRAEASWPGASYLLATLPDERVVCGRFDGRALVDETLSVEDGVPSGHP